MKERLVVALVLAVTLAAVMAAGVIGQQWKQDRLTHTHGGTP